MQFQRVMEPVLARLGVKHYSRNTGMGGLGTIQSVMGAKGMLLSKLEHISYRPRLFTDIIFSRHLWQRL